MEKLLASSGKKNALHDYASKQKVLEIILVRRSFRDS
jgi:hypothetical protein